MKIIANVQDKEYSNTHELWIAEEHGEAELYNLNLNPDGSLKRTKVKLNEENADLEPFMRLRGFFARDIFPAIVEALSKRGFERPSESTLRGRCEAMEHHLEDLRVMLKLRPRDDLKIEVRR